MCHQHELKHDVVTESMIILLNVVTEKNQENYKKQIDNIQFLHEDFFFSFLIAMYLDTQK